MEQVKTSPHLLDDISSSTKLNVYLHFGSA